MKNGYSLLALVGGLALASSAYTAPALEIQKRLSWDVVGLDSNDETTGPDTFAVGYRVCNTGDTAATNVVSSFVWDSVNTLVDLAPGTSGTTSIGQIDPAQCYDSYYNVGVARNDAARGSSRRYHLEFTADSIPSVSTPIDGANYAQIYVEDLISQNRNSINSISGPSTVYQGGIYNFVLDGSTATQGYEQLEAFINFPDNIFRIISVDATYSAPAGGTNDAIYSDSCGWEHDPQEANYFTNGINNACSTSDKAGGNIRLNYTIEVIGTGTSTVTALIYDFSGSSFHYNTDYGSEVLAITALAPPGISVSDASIIEGHSGIRSLGFIVRLSEAKSEGVTFTYSTTAGSAASGPDFTASSGTATITAGSLYTTVQVPIVGELLIEPDETFTFNIDSVSGAALTDGVATGTIINDDAPLPAIDLSIADAISSEGEVLVFDVSLSNASPLATTIIFRTTNGTAGSGDYDTADIQVTIPAGETRAIVRVPTHNDLNPEPDETLTLSVRTLVAGLLDDTSDTATGTILDLPEGATSPPVTSGSGSTIQGARARPVPTIGGPTTISLAGLLLLIAVSFGRPLLGMGQKHE